MAEGWKGPSPSLLTDFFYVKYPAKHNFEINGGPGGGASGRDLGTKAP